MPVNSLRIGHILQHHLTYLQSRFSKSDLQDFDISPLPVVNYQGKRNDRWNKKHTSRSTRSELSFVIANNLCARRTCSSFTNKSFESYMLTSVLMTSLGLLVRNSRDLQEEWFESSAFFLWHFSDTTIPRISGQIKVLTRASVNRIRFPVRVCVILQVGLLERLNGFVFIYQRVPAIIIPD